jgi:hypothetical protein
MNLPLNVRRRRGAGVLRWDLFGDSCRSRCAAKTFCPVPYYRLMHRSKCPLFRHARRDLRTEGVLVVPISVEVARDSSVGGCRTAVAHTVWVNDWPMHETTA